VQEGKARQIRKRRKERRARSTESELGVLLSKLGLELRLLANPTANIRHGGTEKPTYIKKREAGEWRIGGRKSGDEK